MIVKMWISAICILIVHQLAVPVYSGPPMELEERLSSATHVLRETVTAPDAGIPVDLLKRSRGIIVFPALIKAGLGIGGHYGRGVVLRKDPNTGKWGPPAFIRLIGGSFGWQIGVQSTDLILLIMNDISLKSLFKDKITIGADASIAAGPVGRDASAGTDVDFSAGILSYSRAKGLFAGVSIKGSVIESDWESNEAYYGSDVSVIDIFFRGKGTISPAAAELIRFLNKNAS